MPYVLSIVCEPLLYGYFTIFIADSSSEKLSLSINTQRRGWDSYLNDYRLKKLDVHSAFLESLIHVSVTAFVIQTAHYILGKMIIALL